MKCTILDGIRVLDLTQALAGPHCTQLLGDFGAEIVKIERPGTGDQSRGWGPPFKNGESTYFMGTNRNKKSLTLNLKQKEAREVLNRLIDGADVLIHNVPSERGRASLGIDADTVTSRNPRIVWTSISGFGLTGPEAEKPGYDVIAQAMSGTMALTGEAGSPPMRFPTPMADISTGMYATIAILAALYERKQSGKGQILDLALLDCQTTWLANVASAYLETGTPPAKRGNAHPNIAPYQPFQAADGWFILAAGTETHWQRLVNIVQESHPDAGESLAGDEKRFERNADRVANREELERRLNEYFSRETVSVWIERLEGAGIPCGPILRPEETLEHPHIEARGMIQTMEHSVAGTVRSIGNPMQFSRTPPAVEQAAPALGEQTEEILASAGYSEREISTMRENGIV
ncbi:MAG: CaiB/BaiF CoA transferase family protein [Spirochaetales bacterium]